MHEQAKGEGEDFIQEFRQVSADAFTEGVFRVAIAAAEMAPRQSYKDAGFPGMGGFALDGVKDLVDPQEGLLGRLRGDFAGFGLVVDWHSAHGTHRLDRFPSVVILSGPPWTASAVPGAPLAQVAELADASA